MHPLKARRALLFKLVLMEHDGEKADTVIDLSQRRSMTVSAVHACVCRTMASASVKSKRTVKLLNLVSEFIFILAINLFPTFNKAYEPFVSTP